ncbi:MAG: hypothetical protein ACE1ZI_00620, partial [Acidobacteriota bacterium]
PGHLWGGLQLPPQSLFGVTPFSEFQKLSEAPGIIDYEESERIPMRVSYERETEEKQPYQSS